MKDNFQRLKNEFHDTEDLILKRIKVNRFHYVNIAFLETLASSDKIHDYILKNISKINNINQLIDKIPACNIKKLKCYDECEYYIYNGYTLLFINNDIYAIETKADLYRAIPVSENEPSIKGPKLAFTENYQVNLGLIKKRCKTHNLYVENINVGRISNTLTGIISIKGIVKEEYIQTIKDRLLKIDIDMINDADDLVKYLSFKSIIPTVISTERPDKVSDALSNGKVVIICDDSPTALILPAFITDFINPYTDKYHKKNNINITKIIRYICFCVSLITPSLYIAIINFNQETIPSSLIINFAMQRNNIPYPAIIECLIMLVTCEILKESDLRSSSKFGAATSILGAIVLGNAAVSAGLITPIMLIIISFTYIASLIFTDLEFSNALRTYRFIFLFLACFWGLYGLLMGITILMLNIAKTRSLGLPYSIPISPFDKKYFNPFKRSLYLSNNTIKEKK